VNINEISCKCVKTPAECSEIKLRFAVNRPKELTTQMAQQSPTLTRMQDYADLAGLVGVGIKDFIYHSRTHLLSQLL